MPAASLPSSESVRAVWDRLRAEAAAQERSVFETSSAMALSAIRTVPDGVRWLSAAAVAGAGLTGRVVGSALLDHYRETLDELRQTGYAAVREPSAGSVRPCGRRPILARAEDADRTASESPAKSLRSR